MIERGEKREERRIKKRECLADDVSRLRLVLIGSMRPPIDYHSVPYDILDTL